MRDSSAVLWRVLRANEPLAVVLYSDPVARDEICSLVKLLAPPGTDIVRSNDTDDAFGEALASSILLLTPSDEVDAVVTYEARREALINRRVPAILFLLRGGEAQRKLQDAPALTSWLRGDLIDPEALDTVDIGAERERFRAETGQSPEEWLAASSSAAVDTLEANLLRHRARFLEKKD